MRIITILCLFATSYFLLLSCTEPSHKKSKSDGSSTTEEIYHPLAIPKDTLHDKVLGMLVGSAIGDAMGAPTEMWQRENIQVEYGFVNQLEDRFVLLHPKVLGR